MEQRFLRHVNKTNYCWEWFGTKNKNGYGKLGMLYAHRISYELYIGNIPHKMVIDHTCRNHSCVNPNHLEVVTQLENLRRSPYFEGNKTHCSKGHEYSEENTYTEKLKNGKIKRHCKVCRSVAVNKIYHLKNPNAKYYKY